MVQAEQSVIGCLMMAPELLDKARAVLLIGADAAKIEALASGENRYRNLMNLSCCKNEFHVRRRLFHDF